QAYPWARTPNIDQLAKEGIRFAPSYIGTWCMPSRATLLTGHYQHAVQSMRMEGTYPGSTYDPQQCPFWPKVFREHGYCTAQIGKWHTGTDTGYGRDWDYQIVWNRPRFPENSTNYYYDQILTINGGEPKVVPGYSTDNYTRWAAEFIRGEHRDPNKPWYLWLCYGAAHGPYTPADRHLNDYPGAKIPDPADLYPKRPGKPDYAQKMETWVKGPAGEPVLKAAEGGKRNATKTLSDWVRQYQQCVNGLDEGIAQVMKALNESGQRENTLVVMTSDQGFAWGQHGFRHKLAPYDANIASPMIFSMPGTLPQGAVCDVPLSGADLVPTFFSFAGIPLPWEMHGHDVTPLLKDPKAAWPHATLLTFTGATYGDETRQIPSPSERYHQIPWYVLLRQGKYKYIRTFEPGEIEELYDIENDPEELDNLALAASSRDELLKYRNKARAELRRTKAPMVGHLPPVGERISRD
ncbi:MAG: sulfatase-like hydrolase/transferase, partial [Planctomycetes bacterium]|nr:sulfatase-like hydrolase/transferase [Planctomycetota bacterium]